MIRRLVLNRKLQIAALALAVLGLLGWHYQSRLIGVAARWHLQRVSAEEEESGELTRRRQTIARLHRRLLMKPPQDALVPELYDLLTLLSSRVATGEISLDWSAYIYTSHYRSAVLSRANGGERLGFDELAEYVAEQVEFFYLRKRPDVDGYRIRDFVGDGESFTLEEIEQAHREGRDLTVEE